MVSGFIDFSFLAICPQSQAWGKKTNIGLKYIIYPTSDYKIADSSTETALSWPAQKAGRYRFLCSSHLLFFQILEYLGVNIA
jgi:hypothetical protein